MNNEGSSLSEKGHVRFIINTRHARGHQTENPIMQPSTLLAPTRLGAYDSWSWISASG